MKATVSGGIDQGETIVAFSSLADDLKARCSQRLPADDRG